MTIFTKELFGPAVVTAETPEISLFDQIKPMMLATVWVFGGIEGASVISARAEKRSDIRKVIFCSFFGILIYYVSFSVLPAGIMTHAQLVGLKNPSTIAISQYVNQDPVAYLIALNLIISIFGSILAWALLLIELPYIASKDNIFPQMFNKLNKVSIPGTALIVSSLLIQFFTLASYFTSDAYSVLSEIAATGYLLPYLTSSMYFCYLSTRPEYKNSLYTVLGAIASIYVAGIIYSAGIFKVTLVMCLYLVGLIMYLTDKNSPKLVKTEYYTLAGLIILPISGLIYLYS